MAPDGFSGQLKRGRPRAPRRTLHADFVAALVSAPLTKSQVAATAGLHRDELARMRDGQPFPATARAMQSLRRVAARIGYAGPIVPNPEVTLRHRRGYLPSPPLTETEVLVRDVIVAGVVGGVR